MTDLPLPTKRKPLTRREFATLILKQEGRCGCSCGKKLVADRIIDEHLVALDFLGGNALENRSLWDRDCSKAKTAKDLAASAKGKRLRREVGQGPKRKIESRPFSKAYAVESRSPSQWQGAGVSTLSKNHPRYVKRKIGR